VFDTTFASSNRVVRQAVQEARLAHNHLVLGRQNPHSRVPLNQALGDVPATRVLGRSAMALCAVPLLIPVSPVISAQERP